MQNRTKRNIVKQYNRYLRKLRYLLVNESKSPKIHWLRKRLRKLKLTIESRIRTIQLKSKQIVTTAVIASTLATGIQAQQFQLKTNPENPFQDILIPAGRPHFVDFDNDGDDDLFMTAYTYVTEGLRDNGLFYFENVEGSFQKVDNLPFPEDLGLTDFLPTEDSEEVIIAMDFIDFDGDGDVDAFAATYEGTGIVYLENVDGIFSVNAEANPFTDFEISEENFNDVELGDVNGDNIPEAFIADDGTIKIYSLTDGKFQDGVSIDLFGEVATPTLYDIDDDGDLDLVVGNKYGEITAYVNDGGVFTETENHPFSGVTLEFNPTVAFGDINGDSDVDALFGQLYGRLSYFEKEADGFEYVPYNEYGVHFYGASQPIPEMADIDGDGDEDIVVGTWISEVRYLENTGSGFELMEDKNPFGAASGIAFLNIDPNCGDVDNDGDVDCHFLSTYDGVESYFENVDGDFILADSIDNPIVEFSSDANKTIVFEDFDEDGDLDLFIGNKYGEIFYYENVEGVYTEKASVLDPLDTYDSDMRLYFGDVDNDGDNDLIVNVDYETNDYYEKVDGVFVKMEGDDNPFSSLTEEIFSFEFYDIDGDGDEDILASDYYNRALVYENTVMSSSVADEWLSNETSIFPNPATQRINIEMPWIEGKAEISIFNNNGQFVRKLSTSSPIISVSVESLVAGNYHVKIANNEKLAIKKFAVIK